MEFKKYIQKFTQNIENSKDLTHLAFIGGKYNVPDTCYEEFYEKYYQAYVNGESLYIIEKIGNNFAFFIDIEVPKNENLQTIITNENLQSIISKTKQVFEKTFINFDDTLVISKRNNKFHINYPNIIVNSNIAQYLIKNIILVLEQELKKIIDTSVYRTGLRLFGSKKKDADNKKEMEKYLDLGFKEPFQDTYQIYNLNESTESVISFDEFKSMVIRKKETEQLNELKENLKLNNAVSKPIKLKGIENKQESVMIEMEKLMKWLNKEHKSHFKTNITVNKIVSTKNKLGVMCFYISINEKFCPFKDREHMRNNSPIYLELNNNGIYLKCYDEDCIGKKFPDEIVKLPLNFDKEYPNLHKFITIKYWSSDKIVINNELKQVLEESLSQSHYKIAKVAFTIYKERYRIDDIKNPDWYEYRNHHWSKTHVMNLLISEELQKYYKAIKISDTNSNTDTNTDKDDTFQKFIDNKETKNMRNELIDDIIKKLENTSFKKNILNEMYYLFKVHDPNFVSQLDANCHLLGFKNGVYDLSNNTFRNGKHDDYITYSTGYDFIAYDSEFNEIKEIYAFLNKIIPNKKVLDYLLKILGRSLSGVNDERFYIFTGLSGANGKSTLINFLEYTLGDYISSADVSLLTNKRGLSSSASPDVIRLKGKRMVSFAEPENNDTLKTGILKAFSGGDTIISRELYKAPVAFKLQASMFMCCNTIPAVSSIDMGTFRRLRIIEFTSKFCENPKKENEFKIDPMIKEKIKGWRPYFMSMLIHYYNIYNQELSTNGFIEEPDEVKIATNKYKEENDKFDEYIKENIEVSGDFLSLKEIYNHFNNWWVQNNHNNKIPDIKEFKASLINTFGQEVINNKKIGFNVEIVDENVNEY